ncbi:MAG: hypothetical protein Q4F13_09205 [Pseudomonadota bacterium]|nr:hypothetical protein [Pseudomonadota bacterium]
MTLMDLFWHVAGFLAPALVLASAVVGLSWLLWRRQRLAARDRWRQWVANLMVCELVLLGGLMLTGHDGRMLTYAALVLASASCQAWLMRR